MKGTLPPGRLLESIDLGEKTKVIQGPVEAISKISRLRTIAYDLGGINKDSVSALVSLEEVDRRITFKNDKSLKVKILTAVDPNYRPPSKTKIRPGKKVNPNAERLKLQELRMTEPR